MADIHEALTHLSPVDWSDVPTDNLKPYLIENLAAGELICNSLPPLPDGTPFEDAKPHHDKPNTASSHKDMYHSTVLSQPPNQEHADLSKHWGKPQKFKNNPLGVQVYKLAGKDRHGAWFARKSVHEGLGFDKMKRAMLREFPISLAATGGPGAGAVRGMAADKRLERIDVDGVGKLEVYQLGAQFPGPTTPREFVAMLMSRDETLTEGGAEANGGDKKHVPRHFLLVSRPVQHPNTLERSGYVRGQYESVEMIREIPLSTAPAKSSPIFLKGEKESKDSGKESKDAANEPAGSGGDPELNPVEWTMVTRSDPGGGLPRFLVERGTPETMLSDVHKFLDWVCSKDEIPHPDEDLRDEEGTAVPPAGAGNGDTSTNANVPNSSARAENGAPAMNGNTQTASSADSQGGVLSSITSAINAGIQTYAPASVAELVQPHNQTVEDDDSSVSDSDSSTAGSFMSADEMRHGIAPSETHINDSDVLSVASGDLSDTSKENRNHHDNEVRKLVKKRERLDQQLAKKRLAEETKLRQSQEKDSEEAAKYQEKMDKEFKKTEEKHRKEVEKLEARKAKEARKAETKRAKKDDHVKINMLTRERDEFRSERDLLKQENALLHSQVADLEIQNDLMAQRLGNDVLKSIQQESRHRRTDSMKSAKSGKSSSSAGTKS